RLLSRLCIRSRDANFALPLSLDVRTDVATSRGLMFDHVVFGVRDYAVSKASFLKALEPIGLSEVSEGAAGAEAFCRAAGKVVGRMILPGSIWRVPQPN